MECSARVMQTESRELSGTGRAAIVLPAALPDWTWRSRCSLLMVTMSIGER
jgi:hypothetical protein